MKIFQFIIFIPLFFAILFICNLITITFINLPEGSIKFYSAKAISVALATYFSIDVFPVKKKIIAIIVLSFILILIIGFNFYIVFSNPFDIPVNAKIKSNTLFIALSMIIGFVYGLFYEKSKRKNLQ